MSRGRQFVYILRCANGSYYVGHTSDVVERLKAHNDGRGAAYTFKHRPVELVYSEPAEDEQAAIKREVQIKSWSRAKKEALIAGDFQKLHALAVSRD
ncbi:MAG: GIY-YIG nuclease family protein [Candidatus Sumerlaeota bacterium]|nr:GIY-YIG nuclease family protein [Candidatus Sumerlaeota bacterium]